jgi:hypothetical protein
MSKKRVFDLGQKWSFCIYDKKILLKGFGKLTRIFFRFHFDFLPLGFIQHMLKNRQKMKFLPKKSNTRYF